VRTRHDLRIVAIGVGHDQRVGLIGARAHGGDVGNARPEGAGNIFDLLINGIGDLMRDAAQIADLCRRHGVAEQTLLTVHIPQFVFNGHRTVARILDATDDDVILLEQTPGGELDVRTLAGLFDDFAYGQGAEFAAAVEVVANHIGNVGRQRRATLLSERHHRDGCCCFQATDDLHVERLCHGGARDKACH
jgi:hypothetical protein